MEVDKITAAGRLLDEAIRGFLRGDEPLSVHVQVFSAVRVTADLRKGRGLGQSAFDDSLKKEGAQAFWKAFYSVNSFLKHADKDPGETINDDNIPGLNELGIVLAIENLRVLGVPPVVSFWRVYVHCRFFIENPAAVHFMHPDGAAQWELAKGVWAKLDHDYIKEVSRNPSSHNETLDALSALIQKMSAQQDQAQNQAAL